MTAGCDVAVVEAGAGAKWITTGSAMLLHAMLLESGWRTDTTTMQSESMSQEPEPGPWPPQLKSRTSVSDARNVPSGSLLISVLAHPCDEMARHSSTSTMPGPTSTPRQTQA